MWRRVQTDRSKTLKKKQHTLLPAQEHVWLHTHTITHSEHTLPRANHDIIGADVITNPPG